MYAESHALGMPYMCSMIMPVYYNVFGNGRQIGSIPFNTEHGLV